MTIVLFFLTHVKPQPYQGLQQHTRIFVQAIRDSCKPRPTGSSGEITCVPKIHTTGSDVDRNENDFVRTEMDTKDVIPA